jgi:hypothetical protein
MSADRPLRKRQSGSIDLHWEERTRQKIQSSQVVSRLISFVNGEVELAPHQVTAAVALMRKCLPDLVAAEFRGEEVHKFVIAPEVMEKDQWLATRGQPRCDGYASGAHEISKLVRPPNEKPGYPERALARTHEDDAAGEKLG